MFLSILVSWIAIMSGLYTLYIYIYANCGWLGVFVNFRYTGRSKQHKKKSPNIHLMGDFNFAAIDWNENTGPNSKHICQSGYN
jgi:hypothetical protein